MRTLAERRWTGVAGEMSLSIESAAAARRDDRGFPIAVGYLMVLAQAGRERGRGVRSAHVGVMYVGRRPIGLAAQIRGRLHQLWWEGRPA